MMGVNLKVVESVTFQLETETNDSLNIGIWGSVSSLDLKEVVARGEMVYEVK